MSFLDTINNIYGAFSSLVGGIGTSVIPGAKPGNDQTESEPANDLNGYYQALQVVNKPDSNNGSLAVNALPGSNAFNNSVFYDSNFADIMQREIEQGRLDQASAAFGDNDFDQAFKDYIDTEAQQMPKTLPAVSQDAIDQAREDYLNMEANQLPVKFDFNVSTPETTNGLNVGQMGNPADFSAFDQRFDFPTFESFKNAQVDFNNADVRQSLPVLNTAMPSLDNFRQAQQDYFNTQAQQPVVGSGFNFPTLESFIQAQRNFSDIENSGSLEKPDFNFPTLESIDKAREDYLKNDTGFLPTESNVSLPSIDEFNQAREDYLNNETPRTNVDLQSLPTWDDIDQARQDFYKTQAESPILESEMSLPSFEQFLQAKEDFDQTPELLNEPLKNLSISSSSDIDIYNSIFDKKGGIDSNYKPGIDDVRDGLIQSALLNSSIYDRGDISDLATETGISKGLDKMSRETIDNGTMTEQNLKSKYMTGSQYKLYAKNGLGGRPIDEIEDNAIYNKVDEANMYGFRPYVTDIGQFANWSMTQSADDVTKAYNAIHQARDLGTDAKINYGGKLYSRENFYDHIGDYFRNINDLMSNNEYEIIDPDDPSVNEETDLPMTQWYTFPGTDVQIPSDQELQYLWSGDGSKLYVWLPGYEDQAVEYYGIEDYNANKPEWGFYRAQEGDPVHQYWRIPKLEYRQNDGMQVSLPYSDVEEMAQSMANGTADMDWGPFNIAKDDHDRKGFADMVMTGDFSDILPNMIDLTTGSAPLFSPYTAWPMAIANAGTATQGLDPRLYNFKTNNYHGLSDDMTGEKYTANIVLSGLVPLTERIAGGIGGGHGLLGKPLQTALGKIGAPATARSAVDVLGEGVEEDVASAWEDYQVNGLNNWFANPVYETDDYGNVITEYNPVTQREEPKKKYDSTGHEIRDPNTPLPDRIFNYGVQQPDNFLAGTALGLSVRGPRIMHDAATGSGFYGEARERRLLRELEKLNDLPRFREAKRGNARVNITQEDIGTYGKRE